MSYSAQYREGNLKRTSRIGVKRTRNGYII